MKTKWINKRDNVYATFDRIKNIYVNRYFNLFMKYFEFEGLDDNQEDYLMRKFWDTGTIAAFSIKHTDDIGLTQYSTQKWNMYDLPDTVLLINKWNVPFMPNTPQVVDKDVVIGWINANHKALKDVVISYAERMAQVDMVINTNLQIHKMPFLVAVDPTNVDKVKDILARILDNQIAVFTDIDDINLLQTYSTDAPYIIDKLYAYKQQLESELMTIMGLDNMVSDPTKYQLTVDQENSNNSMINASRETMLDCIKKFCDKVGEVLGKQISVKCRLEEAQSVHQSDNYMDNAEEGNVNE